MSYYRYNRRHDEDIDEYKDRLMYEANRSKDTVYAMNILRYLYCMPDNRDATPIGKAIARDEDCFNWICDYWDYVKWNEHGNECNFWEAGGYGGFLDQILDPDAMNDTIDYLLPDGRIPGYERAIELADRLMELHERYVPKSKNRRGRR